MIQIIITPEAIETMGIKYTTSVAIAELKKGQSDWRSLIFVEGISNVQITNILKQILSKVDTAFSIVTRVPLMSVPELTGDNEVQMRYLDAEMN